MDEDTKIAFELCREMEISYVMDLHNGKYAEFIQGKYKTICSKEHFDKVCKRFKNTKHDFFQDMFYELKLKNDKDI